MEQEFRGYRLQAVCGRPDEAVRREIVAMWVGEKVLSPAEAQRRAGEVLFAIRAPDGTLAGVNTVYVQGFQRADNPYHFMRMFMHPAHRGVFGLPRFVARKSFELLREQSGSKGLMIVAENRKLWTERARKALVGMGWTYFGTGPKGNHIFFQGFDGSSVAA